MVLERAKIVLFGKSLKDGLDVGERVRRGEGVRGRGGEGVRERGKEGEMGRGSEGES